MPGREISPALKIKETCENFNIEREKEDKELCRECIESCPYKVKPIKRDEFTEEIKVCVHCPPEEADCLEACRKEGKGAMDIEGNVVVIRPEDKEACYACENKPCVDACMFDAMVYKPEKSKVPAKCDLCTIYKQEKGKPGMEPKCLQACPVDAIEYRMPTERLWLRFSGIEIDPEPPENGERIEKREDIDVEIYDVPGEANKVYRYKLPRLKVKESDILTELLDNALAELIGSFSNKVSQFVDTRRLQDVSYINTIQYKQIENEIRKTVRQLLPKHMKKKFRHNGEKVKYRVVEENGILKLKYITEYGDKKEAKIKDEILTKIADIIEALTHGPGVLKYLLQDKNLEEIEVNGAKRQGEGLPIWVYDKEYGHCKTNLIPRSQEHLRELANKLLQYTKTDEYLSPKSQLISAQLPTGGRLQVVGPERSEYGTSLTIRQYVEEAKSPIWLVNAQENPSISTEGLAMIWQLLESGLHYMVIGGTGTGKTTFLDISTQLFPPSDRIVSIQDVPEINIFQPNKASTVMGKLGGGTDREEAMNDLVKASLRMRPDRLVFGEARGGEARSLFGAALFAGGAPRGVSSTLHVESPEELVERVKLKPMEVPTMHVLGLDMIVSCGRKEDPTTRKPFRHIKSITELKNEANDDGTIPVETLWKYDMDKMDFLPVKGADSILYKNSREIMNITKEEFWQEFKNKALVMSYLDKKRVTDAQEFVSYIDKYYTQTEEEMSEARKEMLRNAKEVLSQEKLDRIEGMKEAIIEAA